MSLYIAYGSNLSIRQMARRCPDAKVAGKGPCTIIKREYRFGEETEETIQGLRFSL